MLVLDLVALVILFLGKKIVENVIELDSMDEVLLVDIVLAELIYEKNILEALLELIDVLVGNVNSLAVNLGKSVDKDEVLYRLLCLCTDCIVDVLSGSGALESESRLKVCVEVALVVLVVGNVFGLIIAVVVSTLVEVVLVVILKALISSVNSLLGKNGNTVLGLVGDVLLCKALRLWLRYQEHHRRGLQEESVREP